MKVSVAMSGPPHGNTALLKRMLCPLSGMSQLVGFAMPGRLEPRIIVAGADLTGVHVLRDEPPPRQGAYHIGGGGLVLEEALIRALAESVERYSQLVADTSRRHAVVLATYEELRSRGRRAIAPARLRLFSDAQLARPDFPFREFRPESPIGWLAAPTLPDGSKVWAPAQQLLVGYRPHPGEQRFVAGVSTGTAAHTSAALALRNALLELVQIDAAMGHWYSGRVARRIGGGPRTDVVERLVDGQFRRYGPVPRFHWLPSPDMPGITVACVLQGATGSHPAAVVGLGCGLRLSDALYKALLEAVGVMHLAKIVLYREIADGLDPIDPAEIFDLDRNVAWYARPENGAHLEASFPGSDMVDPSELPADVDASPEEEVRLLAGAFKATGKDLVVLDLTTPDVRDLGFRSIRAWSPQTLSLSLPSAPPLAHPRFQAYGGARDGRPHPYP